MKQSSRKQMVGYGIALALSLLLAIVLCWVGYEIVREYNELPSALLFFGLGLIAAAGSFFFGKRLRKMSA